MGLFSHMFSAGYTFFTFLLAILLPPLGVMMRTGVNKDVVVNLLLTILGYIPGIIHALWILLTVPSIGSGHHHVSAAGGPAHALKKGL